MQAIKPLSRTKSALVILVAVVIANVSLLIVLKSNLKNGIYPVDADSIGIPIVCALKDSTFLLIVGLIGALLPRRRPVWQVIGRILLVLAGLYASGLTYSWLFPDHYLIGATYLFVAVACIWSLWQPSEKMD